MQTVELVPATTRPGADLDRLRDLADRTTQYVEASRAPSTRKAYASDWRVFLRWCASEGIPAAVPVDVATVALFLTAEAERVTAATLTRRAAAIRYQHHRLGEASPTDHPQIPALLAGIRRTRRDRPRQAKPLYLDDVAAAVTSLGDGPKATRDRALLLVGWWGALRRSELVGLDVGDVNDHPQGVTVQLRRSKTDQAGAGRLVPLHYHCEEVCPVRALRAWRTRAGNADGPLFSRVDRWGNVRPRRLSAQAVSAVAKAASAACGHDPAGYSAHSLRAGFVSECDRRAINSSAVRLVTGHASDAMLATYVRPRNLFESSAGAFFKD